jgi:hypothetical protein
MAWTLIKGFTDFLDLTYQEVVQCKKYNRG